MVGANFDEVVNLGEERKGKDQAYFLDSTKIREQLGWSEVISLENGIDQTISWVKENYDSLRSMDASYAHKP